ncbi:MAG: hypothetical protein K8S16_01075 [Bacteroidales bacterium]|nr:hypothetical protein [Bacteroidales bacterium]
MSRDNFTKTTIDILAKRVGFRCSNPKCKKPTIGPNARDDKATLIGIAAHITGASPGGPRYDENLIVEQRKHISNGIWLCSNCATLIDKDEGAFPTTLLQNWKYEAEMEMRNAIFGNLDIEKPKQHNPFIEADLIWTSCFRGNIGYSPKNREKFGGNVIPTGGKPIIFWELNWRFSFVLHNNSSFPTYNIRIEPTSNVRFSSLTELPKVNNLPPFANIDLEAKCKQIIEGVHTDADALIKEKIPQILEGLELTISYEDENRNTHITIVRIKNQELKNEKMPAVKK